MALRCGRNSSLKNSSRFGNPLKAWRIGHGLGGRFWSSRLRKRRKAASGAWTISWPADFHGGICFWSRATPGPARRRSRCSSCWRARRPARSASTSPCPKPSASCGTGAASHGWSLDERYRGLRAVAAGEPARRRTAAEPALFVRPRTRRNHEADFRGRRARRSRAGWCWTASPRSGCWRKARCAIGGRSWRSSTISRSSAPPCCCSTI